MRVAVCAPQTSRLIQRTAKQQIVLEKDFASFARMSGALSFSKEGGQSVSLTYTDTGMMPSEVSLSAMRAELERR